MSAQWPGSVTLNRETDSTGIAVRQSDSQAQGPHHGSDGIRLHRYINSVRYTFPHAVAKASRHATVQQLGFLVTLQIRKLLYIQKANIRDPVNTDYLRDAVLFFVQVFLKPALFNVT